MKVRTTDPDLSRLRKLCCSLPEVTEVDSWGHPNFRAGKRTFVTFEWIKEQPSIAFRLGIETPGPSMHEADIFRLHPGKTVADLQRWRNEDQPGPAPADAMGGILDSHDLKRVVWLRKNFTPGRYAFHCEMPLTTDASTTGNESSHSDLGMVREFEIKN